MKNVWLLFSVVFVVCVPGARAVELAPKVEIEEDVYSYTEPNNGAGPMWCSGSTCLVRTGDHVFASGIETIPDAQPLNNCRWTLFERGTQGWQRVFVDEKGRTREPAPLTALPDGRVFVSVNPAVSNEPQPNGGPAQPDVLQFRVADLAVGPQSLAPHWQDAPKFTEHSYRSFAADSASGELLLLQNIGYTHAEWTFFDRSASWSAQGKLKWPWGAEYEKPQPIRVCYPDVALHDRAVHLVGVSDIVEPKRAWRDFKRELTGREWDYDFRRLFYTWTSDITQKPFAEWIEIASREDTCGWIMPGDLWVAPTGDVHSVWSERAIDPRLREKFFPSAEQQHMINYARLKDGKIVQRQTLIEAAKQKSSLIGSAPRFQVTADNRLYLVYLVVGAGQDGERVFENRIQEIRADGSAAAAVKIPFEHPFTSYFTTTIRGGSLPSNTLEMLGTRNGGKSTISYGRVQLEPESQK